MEENKSWVDYCEEFCLLIASKAFRFRKYMARICGKDDVYGLERQFLRFETQERAWGAVIYNYGELPYGVYEASVKYYSNINDDSLFFRERNIVILYDDDYLLIPYGAMTQANILETVDAIRCGTYVMPQE